MPDEAKVFMPDDTVFMEKIIAHIINCNSNKIIPGSISFIYWVNHIRTSEIIYTTKKTIIKASMFNISNELIIA